MTLVIGFPFLSWTLLVVLTAVPRLRRDSDHKNAFSCGNHHKKRLKRDGHHNRASPRNVPAITNYGLSREPYGGETMQSETAETAPILPRLPQSLAVQLFAGATPHHLKAGEALFMIGDSGDGCYRLEQGLLKVVITSPRGDNRILAVLGPGSIAGELALLDGRPRSASVLAIGDCELRLVRREAVAAR